MNSKALAHDLPNTADAGNFMPTLRRTILDLAVRGKLVPQNPKDEPASKLLKQIKGEKIKLEKVGKIKPAKSLPLIGSEKPFPIPTGWEWTSLHHIGNIFNGNSINATVKQEKYSAVKNGIPFIATKDVKTGWQKLNYENGISIPKDEPGFRVAHKNAVLICSEGGNAGKKCGFAARNIYFGNKLIANELYGGIESDFVLSWYQTASFSELFTIQMKGIISGISVNNFKSLSIPIPPLTEQKRIVAKVNALMSLCDRMESALSPDAVPSLRRIILDMAVRGKLVLQNPKDEPALKLLKQIKEEKTKLEKAGKIKPAKPLPPLDDSEKPFSIPTGWKWTRLENIGLVAPKNTCQDNVNTSFIPMNLIFSNYGKPHGSRTCLWKDIKKGFTHFAEDDVGVAKITPCFENGKSTVFKNLDSGMGAGTTELHIIRPIFSMSEYVLTFLKSHHFIDKGIPLMTGTVGQKRIPKTFFAACPFPLPPLAEQKRIVAKVNALMALCDQLELALADSRKNRRRLLNSLINTAA